MKRLLISSAMLSLLAAGTANASPVGPVYPPPGGVICCSTVGTSGSTAGVTRTYTGLNPAGNYSDLWFGIYDILVPLLSSSAPGTSQAITGLPSITGNTATWMSAGNWSFAHTTGSFSSPVRVIFSAFDISGSGVGINLVTEGSVAGLTGSEGALLHVTGGLLSSGFKTNVTIQAFNPLSGSWQGVDDIFNQYSTFCTNCVQKSFNGGFWYEPISETAVPEPASMVLLGTGLMAGAGRLRRRARA